MSLDYFKNSIGFHVDGITKDIISKIKNKVINVEINKENKTLLNNNNKQT